MFKFISAISLFLLFPLVGFKYSLKYKKRRDFFYSILSFNRTFFQSVNFRKENLVKILSNNYQSEDFNFLLKSKIAQLQNGNCLNIPDFISENEKTELIDYFDKMGHSDPDTQLKIIKDYDKIFEDIFKECEKENKKQGLLIKKMSFIAGLIAFIIVI